MVGYRELIDGVRARLPGTDAEKAREAVARIVYGLLPWLPPAERAALDEALPAALRPADAEDVPRGGGTADDYIRFVADREGRPLDRVRDEAQAVLSTLAEQEPALGGRLRVVLPPDFGELFAAPAGGAGALDDDEVRALLRRLPEWSGDGRRLSRSVVAPDYLAERLLNRIHAVERQVGHTATISRRPDGSVLIEVWTHSLDRVTDLDAALAEAIEGAIDDVMSEHPPAAPVPPERDIDPRRPPASPVPGTSDRRHRPPPH